MISKFYIYQHRRNDTGDVFYVGKGFGKRAWSKSGRSKHWNNIVNKAGHAVEIVEEFLPECVAFQKEINLIKSIGRQDLGLGSLVNKTDGGEGPSGQIMSQNARDKISKATKGRTFTQAHRDNLEEAAGFAVINDLGEIFKSLTAAANAYGIRGISNITKCCKGKRKTAGSRTWQYYTDKVDKTQISTVGKGPKRKNGYKVIINDINEIFESSAKAAAAYGLNNNAGISACLTGKRKTAGGRSWRYYIKEAI